MYLEQKRFPLFVDLYGRQTVVIGGGKIALRRAKILLQFGANVTLIAPECATVPDGVQYIKRPYMYGDLSGAFLAVAATNDRMVNKQIGQEATQTGVFVSVADCREESSFYFPALCMDKGLIAGIVSQGKDHSKTAHAAQAIRKVLEEVEE